MKGQAPFPRVKDILTVRILRASGLTVEASDLAYMGFCSRNDFHWLP
jgi:hypothetical protein